MKRALTALTLAACLLVCSMALASEAEVEIAYLPEGGFRFCYPAALAPQNTQDEADVLLYAADAAGNVLCVLRYAAGSGVALESLEASLRADEACTDVQLVDARSVAYLTYAADGNVNTVIAGDDGNLYEIMLSGEETFTETAAELVRSSFTPG